MHRIGIAASKIAKGNIALYNLFVILLSFLFSVLIFFMSAFSVLVALFLIVYISNGILGKEVMSDWFPVLQVCMIALAVAVGIINLVAVLKNIKFNTLKDYSDEN